MDNKILRPLQLVLGVANDSLDLTESVQLVKYYQDLWHVEQAFRISKSDLKARPVFHFSHDAIRAHMLICFMSLMIGKFIEIKTGLSPRYVRDMLWQIHEIHLRDALSGKERIVRTSVPVELEQILIAW